MLATCVAALSNTFAKQIFGKFFMAKAKDAASSRAAGAKQVTLPVLARQQMHAARSVADQIEKDSPGAIHAVNFTFSGKRLQASIIYNRDRGRGDVQPGGNADGPPPPAQPQPTKPGQRKPKANKAKGPKGSHNSMRIQYFRRNAGDKNYVGAGCSIFAFLVPHGAPKAAQRILDLSREGVCPQFS